jgi:serine/threonine protein kinase
MCLNHSFIVRTLGRHWRRESKGLFHQVHVVYSKESFSNSTCRKQKQLTIEEFLQLAIKITRAVGDLHNEKVIHFDVKPGNVIYNPSTKVLKLTDLNHAAPVGCTATIFRGTAGSESIVLIRIT